LSKSKGPTSVLESKRNSANGFTVMNAIVIAVFSLLVGAFLGKADVLKDF
jgi:hypothetical protein